IAVGAIEQERLERDLPIWIDYRLTRPPRIGRDLWARLAAPPGGAGVERADVLTGHDRQTGSGVPGHAVAREPHARRGAATSDGDDPQSIGGAVLDDVLRHRDVRYAVAQHHLGAERAYDHIARERRV